MIKNTVDQDIKAAMLSGDKRTANALRNLKSAILSAEIATNKRDQGLSDTEVIAIFQKELKKRAEAAALYKQGGNQEQADEELFEEGLIKKYLPKPLDEGEIKSLIEEAIGELNEQPDIKVMGKVIAAVKQKSQGSADGALVARLVKERLS